MHQKSWDKNGFPRHQKEKPSFFLKNLLNFKKKQGLGGISWKESLGGNFGGSSDKQKILTKKLDWLTFSEGRTASTWNIFTTGSKSWPFTKKNLKWWWHYVPHDIYVFQVGLPKETVKKITQISRPPFYNIKHPQTNKLSAYCRWKKTHDFVLKLELEYLKLTCCWGSPAPAGMYTTL